jgi:hypothetical protein
VYSLFKRFVSMNNFPSTSTNTAEPLGP